MRHHERVSVDSKIVLGMRKFKLSVVEILMLTILGGVLYSLQRHVNYQLTTPETVWAIEFSPDGRLLARASTLGVTLFDLNTFKPTGALDVAAGAVAFSPNSGLLALGGVDGGVCIWNIATGVTRSTPGHDSWVRSVAFSSDGNRLYSAGRDKTVKAWDVPSGKLRGTTVSGIGEIESMAISPDGKLLATGATSGASGRHHIEFWDTKTGELLNTLAGPEYCYVYKLTFSPAGEKLATGLSVPTVRLWNVSTGEESLTLPNAVGRDLVSFSPTGRHLVTSFAKRAPGLNTGTDVDEKRMRACPHNWGGLLEGVGVWSIDTGDLTSTLGGHDGPVQAIRFSRDETTLVTAGEDASLITWDLATGRKISTTSGLTTRPDPIPWVMLACFCAWLIGWCMLTYLVPYFRSTENWTTHSSVLVALAATYFVVNGLLLIGISQGGWGSDPISALFCLSFLAIGALLGLACSLASRVIRSRALLWVVGVGVIGFVFMYDLHVLAETVASV